MPALVLDSHPDYRELVLHVCARLEVAARCVGSADELIASGDAPGLLLVVGDAADLGGLDGIERLRRRSQVPLIVLGGTDATERVLDAGADYHIAKPFAPGLLRSAARAVLRRSPHVSPMGHDLVPFGQGVFEPARRRISSERARLPLTAREADLLHFLTVNVGRVVSRAQIIDGAWGGVAEATDGAVVSSVYRLRRKLAGAGVAARIATVPGHGYRLTVQQAPPASLAGAGRTAR